MNLYNEFRFFQEARGLDAGPRLVQKLIGFGDHRTSNIVAKIAEEEVAHVAVGVFWFSLLCQKMGRTPSDSFKGEMTLFFFSFNFNVSNCSISCFRFVKGV